MDKRLLIAVAASIAAILALPALGAPPDYAALRNALQTEHVQPGYVHFADKARGLDHAITAHCLNTGDNPQQLAAKTAFHEALDVWQAVQHIRHGAVTTQDRHARLQFWPDQRGTGERHMRKLLAAPLADTLMDDITTTSVALQGFPALERLLFADQPLSQRPLEGETAARCPVARAIAHNIAGIAGALASAEPQSTDDKTFVADAVNDLVVGLEFIRSLKLKLPAGVRKPRPHLLENWRSHRSLRNVEINIRALRALYGILASGLADNAGTAKVLSDFDTALDAVRAMGKNGEVVLGEDDGPKRFKALAALIEHLRDDMVKTMPENLGITLGFNSLDGD
ncbi:MAG: imelysin family protein [Rhodospirillales bacterium]|nr:imelysin family protein [Rhodospirillales bacterium]MBO6788282.1 imelysin family protein [Rhodospirillales bacterium]